MHAITTGYYAIGRPGFGVENSWAQFQRMMEWFLKELPCKNPYFWRGLHRKFSGMTFF